jgi:leader peptidase (prepilin peptidase) / N-methyltransferase
MTPLQLYIDLCVFLFGAAVGSFLNVCVHRMPREQSIVTPPSSCPHCGQRIRWFDNIPLVSYLVLRGRCRNCGTHFTARYFLVELLTAVLFLTIWLRFGGWLAPIYWLLVGGLIAATFIDFEHFIIPNEITYGGVVLGLLLSTLYPPLMRAHSVPHSLGRSFLGMLTGGAVLMVIVEVGKLIFGRHKIPLDPDTQIVVTGEKLCIGDEEMAWPDLFYRESDAIEFHAKSLKFADKTFENVKVVIHETKLTVNGQDYDLASLGPIEATADLIIIPREAMGLGDVKLMAAIGAFLGWRAALFTVFASSLVGGVVGLALILMKRTDWQSRIPYGPYIVIGSLTWIFFGQQLVGWYMRFVRG